MSISDFRAVFVRDLKAVRREVEAYPDETLLWKEAPGIANPAGTLVLHLCGNLRHFVGAVLGGQPYERDRDAEFSRRDVPRTELLKELDASIEAIDDALGRPEDARLSARYPMPIGGRMLTTSQFLVHLAAHLGYHLGQIDYHRRMLDPKAKSVGTLPLDELPNVEPPPDPEEFAAKAAQASPAESLLAALESDEVPGRITPSKGRRKITPVRGTPTKPSAA